MIGVEAAAGAPPIAVIEDQLGYLPYVDGRGKKVFVPARVFEESSPQAVNLAKHLRRTGAVFYGAYWCPHCRNQRRIFGKSALELVPYRECDPRGMGYKAGSCKQVEAYPTWSIGGQRVSGELSLAELARMSNFPGEIDAVLEGTNPRPPAAGAECAPPK